MPRLFLFAIAALALPAPAQTVLTATNTHTSRLRIGSTVTATLTEPAFEGTVRVLPVRTTLQGHIVSLEPDHAKRVRGRWNLDFTPWSHAAVMFEKATLPDGSVVSLAADPAMGAPAAVTARAGGSIGHGNFVSRQFHAVVGTVRSTLEFFIAPGRGDRMRDLALHQLPWHPQWVNAGTVWQVRLAAPVAVANAEQVTAEEAEEVPVTLDMGLSSAMARAGDAVAATVQRPVHALGRIIPQGTKFLGRVTEAVPAGSLNRGGHLRFQFDHMRLPDGSEQRFGGEIASATTAGEDRVTIDREGGVTPAPEDRFVVPTVLLVLAASPLTPDPGDNDEFVKNAGASNGLGAVGFAVGVAVNNSSVAAGLGFYSAAVSTGYRWLAHGHDVAFRRDTRMEVRVTPAP